jgi:putative flippase GtrA
VLRVQIVQLFRYGVSAGSVALLYILVYGAGLQLGLYYFVAILIAQVIAISVAFPLYRAFVFASTGPIRSDFAKFLGVWSGGAIAGLIATPILVELFGVNPFWAQVFSILVISVASFLAHRIFTFGRRDTADSEPASDETKIPS